MIEKRPGESLDGRMTDEADGNRFVFLIRTSVNTMLSQTPSSGRGP